jgi:hypothetical protein
VIDECEAVQQIRQKSILSNKNLFSCVRDMVETTNNRQSIGSGAKTPIYQINTYSNSVDDYSRCS